MPSQPQEPRSYFAEHYEDLHWPLQTSTLAGFRPPQVGALHAIGAHFSQRTDRAIITMPTGTGKTAVLCAACFGLRCTRVLVITPSRLVREQIVEEFTTLGTLKNLRALGNDVPAPKVKNVVSRITSLADWEALQDFDVVVGTPASLSPGTQGIPDPPPGLFDLVLVDEAHHSPANTWTALLDHYSKAKQVLFTATPFRADQREIKGRFAYTYDLRSAYDDKVFGQIEYLPVRPARDEDPDLMIALAAEQILRADREAGLDHLLMVRTGQRKRAHELKALYDSRTGLKLEVITGDNSLTRVRQTLARLESRELDGIICVDMLGEGFNLPALKVAALHSPHKSLAVTLQFIGRFARTTGPRLGRAAFLAAASPELTVESERLYQDGAVWEEIIPSLGSARVAEEQRTQEVLQSFEAQDGDFADVPDLSLYAIRPYFHVKVLNAGSGTDLYRNIAMPGGAEVVYRYESREHSTILNIARTRSRPRWTTAAHLDAIAYELFILHLHPESGYLFVCSSRRDDDLYQHFAAQFAPAGGPQPRGLSSFKLQRVLSGLGGLRFFNIGMRNGAASDREASYVTMAGSAVDQALEQNDGRRFHRGHWFCKASEGGQDVTIGLSTASKVWSNSSDRLPGLIAWCDLIAEKLLRGQAPRTNTGIDHLGAGVEIENLPTDIIAADWHRSAYTHPKRLQYVLSDGRTIRGQLLDLEFLVERGRTRGNTVGLLFRADDYEYRAAFSLDSETRLIEPDDEKPEPSVVGESTMSLTAYLNEQYPTFYTSGFAYVVGGDLFETRIEGTLAFDRARLETPDWNREAVDIEVELGEAGDGKRCVHTWLEESLRLSDAEVVFYDHGSGEIGDFLTVKGEADHVLVTLYHCKGSGRARPGARVEDVYEVCGQAVKSKNWGNTSRLLQSVRSRFERRGGKSRFVKGDLPGLEALLGRTIDVQFQVAIVQPGISKAALSGAVSEVLAAADEFVFGQKFRRLRVIGSA